MSTTGQVRELERSVSSLSVASVDSLASNEDWDRSQTVDISKLPSPPSTPPPHLRHARRSTAGRVEDIRGTPPSARADRSLSELLRAHAEMGRDVNITSDEERRLSDELARWINSDFSPYEPSDDAYFLRHSTSSSPALPSPDTTLDEDVTLSLNNMQLKDHSHSQAQDTTTPRQLHTNTESCNSVSSKSN
jgi:hypothetical protein